MHGVALLYDFDYQLKPKWRDRAGPLAFVESFAFVKTRPNADLAPLAAVSQRTGYSLAAVAHVITTLERLAQADRNHGGPGQVGASDLCAALTADGPTSERVLREFGLIRSEDVGRVIYGMIDAKLFRPGSGESEVDFAGLYAPHRETQTWSLVGAVVNQKMRTRSPSRPRLCRLPLRGGET